MSGDDPKRTLPCRRDRPNVLPLIDLVFTRGAYAATRDRPRATPRPMVCIERSQRWQLRLNGTPLWGLLRELQSQRRGCVLRHEAGTTQRHDQPKARATLHSSSISRAETLLARRSMVSTWHSLSMRPDGRAARKSMG